MMARLIVRRNIEDKETLRLENTAPKGRAE
jgi:hypothetical protein